MRIYWGTVDKNGDAVSGGKSVTKVNTGQYSIIFGFNGLPAIVGSQTRYGKLDEANTDGIVFTPVMAKVATAITGNNVGVKEDRSFSFMAAGENDETSTDRVLWGLGACRLKSLSTLSNRYSLEFSVSNVLVKCNENSLWAKQTD